MGCLASLVSFASCLLPSRASTGAGSSCYLFNKCMFSFQNSSYSTVLLAVAKTRALAPKRHQLEDKMP
jgi:hypothetical protein